MYIVRFLFWTEGSVDPVLWNFFCDKVIGMSDEPEYQTITWPDGDSKLRLRLLQLLRAGAFKDVTLGIMEEGKPMRYLEAHR